MDLQHLGVIDVRDWRFLSEVVGRDYPPFPFMSTRPTPFATGDAAAAHAADLHDRFGTGDLGWMRPCLSGYANADVRVEFHVQFIPADTPSVRMLAYRCGERGFLAEQRADDDVIDVHAISPFALGDAVGEAAPLTQPGIHDEIVVPAFIPVELRAFDHGESGIRDTGPSSRVTQIPHSWVTAYATVHSHWRPARRRLPDPNTGLLWVTVDQDGDYLYDPDRSCARPLTTQRLIERVDQLIAEDIVELREHRGE